MTRYSKTEARELIDDKLRALTPEEYKKKSNAALGHLELLLLNLQVKHKIDSMLSYRFLEKWREVDVVSLENKFSKITLDHAPLEPQAHFPAYQYDVILVPLYGFSADGYRLGHGGGWYDRFLASQPNALKIGIGLEEGYIDFNIDPHDIPMDSIVTDSRSNLL